MGLETRLGDELARKQSFKSIHKIITYLCRLLLALGVRYVNKLWNGCFLVFCVQVEVMEILFLSQ